MLNKAYNTVYVHPALFSPVILAIPLVSVGLLLANFFAVFLRYEAVRNTQMM